MMKLSAAFVLAAILVSPTWAAQNTAIVKEVAKYSVHQDSPCVGQARTLQELTRSFNGGQLPTASDMTGTWVEIGFFEARARAGKPSDRNCPGLVRGKKFEAVMIANGYSLELHIIGTHVQRVTATLDAKGSLSFPVDFEGDALPTYRCRLIGPGTLACLVSTYQQGVEFKKKVVRQNEIYSPQSSVSR